MTSQLQFEKLLQPGQIKNISLRNRIVLSALATHFADQSGLVTQRLVNYYEERARGGVGLIVVESASVDLSVSRTGTCQLAVDSDEAVPGLRHLTESIHKHGANVVCQIQHAGPHPKAPHPVAASQVIEGSRVARELEVAELSGIVAAHAAAAERAKRAGFDAVMIQMAGGHLLAGFLSPFWNRRSDAYGGELANRVRLPFEIVKAVREVVGPNYPLLCRINAVENGMDNGIAARESHQIASIMQSGGVDAISLMAYGKGKYRLSVTPRKNGATVPYVGDLKTLLDVPVMFGGRIDPELGETLLRERKADFIEMGRALVADPELPKKILEGRLDEIRPCISCLNCYNQIIFQDKPLACTVNPAAGREADCRIGKAAKRKSVIVIGGGPGGIQAAVVAAIRGHQVTLFERDSKLGGQLIPASIPFDKKHEIEPYTAFLVRQVEKLEIEVRLEREATSELVEGIRPDAVVLATGSRPVLPRIDGIDRAGVFSARDVLTGKVEVGAKVVVIGGGMVGCETAEFLSARGKLVTVVEMLPELATQLMPILRQLLLDTLVERGVVLLAGTRCDRITGNGLYITTKEGQEQFVEADSLVIAAGAAPDSALLKALEDKQAELRAVGDCVEPRKIIEAVAEGFRASLDL